MQLEGIAKLKVISTGPYSDSYLGLKIRLEIRLQTLGLKNL